MKFQLALDTFELDKAIDIAQKLEEYIDVFEAGTPMVLRYGSRAIIELRKNFPKHDILADYKMMDAGDYEADIAFSAGASLVTVCGAANMATIEGAIRQSKERNTGVIIDMISAEGLEEKLARYDSLGAAYIQIHTATDGRGDKSPLEELEVAARVLKQTPYSVAGGIGLHSIREIAKLSPSLVLGSQLLAAKDRLSEMKAIIKVTEEVNA